MAREYSQAARDRRNLQRRLRRDPGKVSAAVLDDMRNNYPGAIPLAVPVQFRGKPRETERH